MKEATSGPTGQVLLNPSRKNRKDPTSKSSEGIPDYRSKRYSSGYTLHSTYDNFFKSINDCDNYVKCNIDFMFTDRRNFCSGYFPDFITLDNINAYELSKGNDYSKYYLYTRNNKHLKQLANCRSKYNDNYFYNMYSAYKICKSQGDLLCTQEGYSLPEKKTMGGPSQGK